MLLFHIKPIVIPLTFYIANAKLRMVNMFLNSVKSPSPVVSSTFKNYTQYSSIIIEFSESSTHHFIRDSASHDWHSLLITNPLTQAPYRVKIRVGFDNTVSMCLRDKTYL